MLVMATLLLLPAAAGSKVFYAREEMPSLAFPTADKVDAHDYFLTHEQRAEIERRAQSKLESDLFTVYTGRREGQVLGYAILDMHIVRTVAETFLVVLAPDGSVAATHVLAFYEPLEYLPPKRWLAQFQGKRLANELRLGGDIAAITGSTLSSRAIVGGIRRALAAYEVLIAPCVSSSAENGPRTDCSR